MLNHFLSKTRRGLSAVLTLIVLSGSLAGCSGSSSGGSQPSQQASQQSAQSQSAGGQSTTLEIWVRDRFYSLVTEAAKSYHEKNPGVTVKVTQPSNMSDNLALALTAHNTPDIVSIDCVLVPYYASIGAMEDITDRFSQLDYKDQFGGGLMDLSKYNGKQYAVPFAPDLSVLLWNKEIFKEAGLDPEKGPATWDELIKDAQACTSKQHYGYVFGAGDAGTMMFTFSPYIWSNGGAFTDKDGTKSMLGQPQAIGALQNVVDMVSKYKVTPKSVISYDWSAAEDAFKSGKTSMIALGTDAVGSIVQNKYNFKAGCCLLPSADGKDYASFSGGDSIGIMADSKKKEAAWDFVQYCLSKDFQVDKLAANGFVPARMDLFDNSYFASHPEYDVLKQAMTVGKAPYSTQYNALYKPFGDAVQSAIGGQKTAEQAFTDAAKQIDDILANKKLAKAVRICKGRKPYGLWLSALL